MEEKNLNIKDNKIKYKIDKKHVFSNVIKNGGWVLRQMSVRNVDGGNIETGDNK